VPYQKKGGTCREVWSNAITGNYRDTHAWSGDQIWDLKIIGFGDLRCPGISFAATAGQIICLPKIRTM
jgi:hypothetical protein